MQYAGGPIGVQSGKMLVRIDGKESIAGKEYYKYVHVYSGIPGAETEVHYYRRPPEGIWRLAGKDKEYLETPFPVKVGDKWTVAYPTEKTEYYAEAIETLELLDKNKKYDNCLKISFKTTDNDGATIEGQRYLARGIGLVKEVNRIEDVFGGRGVVELVLDKHTR